MSESPFSNHADPSARLLSGLTQRPDRLVLLFAFGVVIMVCLTTAYDIWNDRRVALDEWSRNQANLTRSFGEHIARTIGVVDHDLNFIRHQYVESGRALDLPKLGRQEAIERIYRRIGIVDTNGQYIASSRPWTSVSPQDLLALKAQKEGAGDSLLISQPNKRRAGPGWSIHISRPLIGERAEFQGIVVASIDPEYLAALYAEMDLGENGIVTVVGTDDGIVRARKTNGVFSLGQSLGHSSLMHEFRGMQSGSYIQESKRDGILRLYTFYRLAEYPLTVVTGVTLKKIHARTNEAAVGQLLVGVAAKGAIMLFALVIARLLRRQAKTMEALRESQRQAESANKMKSEFLASMSHELRTPLHGILSFADIIARKAGEDKIRRQAGIIHNSGKHLLELLNGILDLAKIEAGKMDLNLRREELRPLFRGAVELHEMSADAKHLWLTACVADEVPEFALCDATLLRQVLNNLINNAIKFTEAGGVCVSLSVAAHEPGMLQLEVRDTGIGIAPEAQQLVFEKFRQADQSATRAHQGTGLGLTLTKHLVELMGGRIALESTPGLGTAVRVALPLETLQTPPAPAPRELAAA